MLNAVANSTTVTGNNAGYGAAGEQLPQEFIPDMGRVVRGLAGRLHARLPHGCGIEMADLIQAGNVGLLQATRNFEACHGAHLAGYAKFRIRGEMLDTVRRNAGRGQSATLLKAAKEDEAGWESTLPASPESSPHCSLMTKQRADIIREEIDRLPARYRKVVGLRYSRELTLRQIGALLSVNESRACQIHRSALNRLKRALANRGVRGLAYL